MAEISKIIIETEVSSLVKDEKTGITSEQKKKIKEFISPKTCYDIMKNICRFSSEFTLNIW